MKTGIRRNLIAAITVFGAMALTAPPIMALELKDLLDLNALKAEQAKCDKTNEDCMQRCSKLASDKDYTKCTGKCNKSYSGCIGRAGKDVIIDQLAKEVQKRKDQKLAQEIAVYAQKRLAEQRKGFKKCDGLSEACIEKCYGDAAKGIGKKKRDWDSMSNAERKRHDGLLVKCATKKRCYYKSNECKEQVVDSIPVVDDKMKKMIKALK